MEFRASSNGATELQTGTLLSTAHFPVSELLIDICMLIQSVTLKPGCQADAEGRVRPKAAGGIVMLADLPIWTTQ